MVAARSDAPAGPQGQCLLVSLPSKGAAAEGWHARVVSPTGEVHDFFSPFELVRYLVRQTERMRRAPDSEDPNRPRGLR